MARNTKRSNTPKHSLERTLKKKKKKKKKFGEIFPIRMLAENIDLTFDV
jgi:hypothetical protein